MTKEATCTEAGTETYTCSACGDSYDVPIAPKGHDYTEKVIEEATCTEPGTMEYTCSVCGETTRGPISPTGAHDYAPEEKRVWVTDVLAYDAQETTGYDEYFMCNSRSCGEKFDTLEEIAAHKAADIEASQKKNGSHGGIILHKDPVKTAVHEDEQGHYETVTVNACRDCGAVESHQHEYAPYYQKVQVIDQEAGSSVSAITNCDERFSDYKGSIGTGGIGFIVCFGDGVGSEDDPYNCWKAFATDDAYMAHSKETGHGHTTTGGFAISEENEEVSHYEKVKMGEKCIICGQEK